uniref:Retrotransposon gag domain-containing protein n=1 Tax=Arundo donax TaxID=35708 RepID=A0A0A8ZMP2_ARUDO
MASFYLDDVAQQWYHRLERNRGVPTWQEFVAAINCRFGPPIRSNPFGELMQLRRTGTVAEYQDRFLTLLARCDSVTEDQQRDDGF